DNLCAHGDRQLAIQRRRGLNEAAHIHCASLNRARRRRYLSGQYVGSYLDAGAASVVDRRHTLHFAVAQPATDDFQCVSDRNRVWFGADGEGSASAIRVVFLSATRVS